jgi:hypothetical protein
MHQRQRKRRRKTRKRKRQRKQKRRRRRRQRRKMRTFDVAPLSLQASQPLRLVPWPRSWPEHPPSLHHPLRPYSKWEGPTAKKTGSGKAREGT